MNAPVRASFFAPDVASGLASVAAHPMPETAAFVARLKAAFGAAEIDAAIRAGKTGEATFHAVENGHAAGTAGPSGDAWIVDHAVRDRHYCPGCDGRCVGTARSCTRG